MAVRDFLVTEIVVGTADWEGGSKGSRTEAFIYWNTPEAWANLIWNWVSG